MTREATAQIIEGDDHNTAEFTTDATTDAELTTAAIHEAQGEPEEDEEREEPTGITTARLSPTLLAAHVTWLRGEDWHLFITTEEA